jgi:hypothetical protein
MTSLEGKKANIVHKDQRPKKKKKKKSEGWLKLCLRTFHVLARPVHPSTPRFYPCYSKPMTSPASARTRRRTRSLHRPHNPRPTTSSPSHLSFQSRCRNIQERGEKKGKLLVLFKFPASLFLAASPKLLELGMGRLSLCSARR